MPDWAENTLYLMAGGCVGIFIAALGFVAARADGIAERDAEIRKLEEQRARYTGERRVHLYRQAGR